MNATKKAWVVAATIGAVEALKDQGICRWNYTIRSIQQHAKNNIRSFAQANMVSSSGSGSSGSVSASGSSSTPPTPAAAAMSNESRINPNGKLKKKEASLEKVLVLSCWGPSTTRF
ncbi:hypothetical protein P3X46_027066 [Hevea brasiliensis]|uniref:Wound-responsive family protein n=2 Tax=Hevea brasiliensis TaxID=3981 RepID=A0ABQ9KYN4_HEVBR|nr:hypothetical protein P3X46_027066 [Hevea brasiliensis]